MTFDFYTMWICWIACYIVLGRVLKAWSDNVQLHSVIHCLVASIWTSYGLYTITGIQLLGFDIYTLLSAPSITHSQKAILLHAAAHSAGYFIGDTIDIFLDYTSSQQLVLKRFEKRKIYVFHHLVALLGILMTFGGSYVAVYGIWTLEIGGVVHHLRHAARVGWPAGRLALAADLLYHTVYVSTRMLLFVNVTKSFMLLYRSQQPMLDVVCLTVSYILVVQNAIWWVKNAKTLLREWGQSTNSKSSSPAASERMGTKHQ